MNERSTKVKDVYVPLICIGIALVLMMIDVIFFSKKSYDSPLQGILLIVVCKPVMYAIVIALGLVLCGWFGYPFDSFLVSLLQLVAVVLLAGAVGNSLVTVIGGAAFYLKIVIFLGLMGYFLVMTRLMRLLPYLLSMPHIQL